MNSRRDIYNMRVCTLYRYYSFSFFFFLGRTPYTETSKIDTTIAGINFGGLYCSIITLIGHINVIERYRTLYRILVECRKSMI